MRPHPYLEILGARISQQRKAKGMTLSKLAKGCGIDTSRLSKIEHGKINITLTILVKIAACLEIPVEQLLGGDGKVIQMISNLKK